MFDPQAYPYVRAETYTDGSAPEVLSDVFYNPTQDALARLFGASSGISTHIATDDFCTQGSGLVAPTRFGEQLTAATLVNVGVQTAPATGDGVCGAWRAYVIAGGSAFNFVAFDAPINLGARDWIFVARVRVKARARADTVANGGLVVGLGSLATGLPVFVAGSDQANWQAISTDLGTQDTGVQVVDDQWIWLILSSFGGTLHWYTTTGGPVGAAVATVAAPSIASANRYFRWRNTAGAAQANDYFEADFFSRAMGR